MDGVVRAILCLGLVFRMVHLEAMRKRSPIYRDKNLRIRLIKFFKQSVSVLLIFQVLFFDLLPISDQSTPFHKLSELRFISHRGLAISVMSRLQLGKNWSRYGRLPARCQDIHSITQGLYRYIRHPIYTGDFLLFVGFTASARLLVGSGCFCL